MTAVVAQLMTDIHAHVLPSLDDGPADMQATIELLQTMRDANTHRVFCTPHYHHPHFDVTEDAMVSMFQRVQTVQRAGLLRPEVNLGAEVRLCPRLLDDIKTNRVRTLGKTSYVLVEFDASSISDASLRLIYELRIRGFSPIMVHPERHLAIQRDSRWINILRAEGVLLQTTAACYAAGTKTRSAAVKLAWKLLRQGHVDLVASDTHGVHHGQLLLDAAYDRISFVAGQPVVDKLISNANAVWENEPCQAVPTSIKQSRHLWHMLRLVKPTEHDSTRS